jgi:hypothetical protein
VLHARVIKCGWSSSNTASLSACEQYLTQVYGKRNRITTGNSKEKSNVKLNAQCKVKAKRYLQNTRRNMGSCNFRNFALHLL